MFLYIYIIMVRKQLLDDYLTLENIIGVLLAILIIFDLKIENSICKLLNTPIGIISSGIIVIILFVMLHPVIGILFLIYLYQCMLKYPDSYNEETKNKILQKMNPEYEQQVEEKVILEKAPIKNQNKNNNVEFSPYVVNAGSTY
jgi:predicted membrane protein